jgi:Trypsin-like serine proteases, typically periplasmic, contain C-terminal PDZ domain
MGNMAKKSLFKRVVIASAIFMCVSMPSASAAASVGKLPTELIPSGKIVGISIKSDGVVVISLGEVNTDHGKTTPAADAGLLTGDIIKNIGSQKIASIDDLKSSLKSNEGKEISVSVERCGKRLQFSVKPVLSTNGIYEMGVWLRDGLAGMGTVTFVEPKSGVLGVLGHAINDTDTKILLPIQSGMLMDACVGTIIKGRSGCPGQVQGSLDFEKKFATININTENGVFGKTDNAEILKGKAIPVGLEKDLRVGEAYILSNISGEFESYGIEISRIYSGCENRNMLITVTDEKLISQTGGIVQGMSGSPIIQNGKIVGAVTHVLVNEPLKGYAISIEKMLEKAFEDEQQMAA